MATRTLFLFLFVFTHLVVCRAHAGDFRINGDSARARVVRTAKSLLYVKEKTNKNDHPMINTMFEKIGYPGMKNAAWTSRMWCMAYVQYCFTVNDIKTGIKGPAAVVNWKAAISKHISTTRAPKAADVVIFTWGSHGGLVIDPHPNPAFPFVYTIEGNTSAPRGEAIQRQGVWLKTRLRKEIRYFVRVINDQT